MVELKKFKCEYLNGITYTRMLWTINRYIIETKIDQK